MGLVVSDSISLVLIEGELNLPPDRVADFTISLYEVARAITTFFDLYIFKKLLRGCSHRFLFYFWSGEWDSNPQLSAWKAEALAN